MLTPQEVSERSFPKAKFGGYDMADVDDFLDVLTEDYSALYKETAMLKNKMKVLVEKISEYRSTEDAMRTTLLTAQKMASSMIAEAEQKKAQIIKEAESVVQSRVDELHRAVADEQLRLNTAQSATASFVKQVRDACQRELSVLDSLPEITAPPMETAPAPDPVDAAAADIDSSLSKIVGMDAEPAPEASPAPQGTDAALDELQAQATRRIDFNSLQFGRDYEIK